MDDAPSAAAVRMKVPEKGEKRSALSIGDGLVLSAAGRKSSSKKRGNVMARILAWMLHPGTLKASLAFAASAVAFRALARFGGKPGEKSPRKTAFIVIASLLCSQWLRIVESDATRSTFCFYTLVRAADIIVEKMAKENRASIARYPLIFHADGFLFVFACFEIMRNWFYDRSKLPRSYAHWISKMADMDEDLIGALRKLKERKLKYGKKSDFLQAYCERNGVDPSIADFTHFIPSRVIHPKDGDSTAQNLARRWLEGFQKSMFIYLPLHIMPLLINRKAPTAKSSTRIIASASRSSAFLASFIALAWAPILILRRLRRDDVPSNVYAGCFLCGFSIFLEKSGRRKELMMYVLPRALESAARAAGIRLADQSTDVWIFAFSMTVLMRAHANNASSFGSPLVKKGFQVVVGKV